MPDFARLCALSAKARTRCPRLSDRLVSRDALHRGGANCTAADTRTDGQAPQVPRVDQRGGRHQPRHESRVASGKKHRRHDPETDHRLGEASEKYRPRQLRTVSSAVNGSDAAHIAK